MSPIEKTILAFAIRVNLTKIKDHIIVTYPDMIYYLKTDQEYRQIFIEELQKLLSTELNRPATITSN
jgi:DNA replication protein DnaC